MSGHAISEADSAVGVGMDWDVTEASVYNDYSLSVEFRDGTRGKVVFLPEAFRGMFASLKDPERFRQVKVVNGVVTWPGDLDLAPDAMHRQIRTKGEWVLE